jgi:hypothetical protein
MPHRPVGIASLHGKVTGPQACLGIVGVDREHPFKRSQRRGGIIGFQQSGLLQQQVDRLRLQCLDLRQFFVRLLLKQCGSVAGVACGEALCGGGGGSGRLRA